MLDGTEIVLQINFGNNAAVNENLNACGKLS